MGRNRSGICYTSRRYCYDVVQRAGVATGAEFRDAEGKLLGHIVRKFDAEGRIVAEEQFADAPHDFVLPEEIRSNLNPGQIKAVGAFAASVENRANSYSYDAQGRVTERHRSGGPFGDEVTITNYNDHGDKASERTTTVMNPEAGRQYTVSEAGTMIPVGQPPPPPTTCRIRNTIHSPIRRVWQLDRTDDCRPL